MHVTIEDILSITGGKLIPAKDNKIFPISGVSIDSRSIEKDVLFVCIVGNTVDSHAFVEQAVQNGATAVLAERNPCIGEILVPIILVKNTVESLCLIAQKMREQTHAKVIGITGSAGKTTVKEFIAQLLSTELCVAKNYLNYNTQIGMSVSMLQAEGNEKVWVMEVGISKTDDMAELGSILKPDIALILNVGSAHVEGLGEKGVAYHKASLLNYLKKDGVAFISGDYPELVHEAQKIVSEPYFFSTKNENVPYYGQYIGVSDLGKSIYRLRLDGEFLDVETPFLGSLGTESVIASAAVAHVFGISKEHIVNTFSRITLPRQRFNCSQIGDWVCIDDSYNANPLSMKKTILTAFEVSKEKEPLIYVLGEMLELGDQSEKEHEELGYVLAGTSAKIIFWKGEQLDAVKIGLKRGRFAGVVQKISTNKEFRESIQSYNMNKGVIVFKGSRSNKMELLVDTFTRWVGAH